MEGMEIRPPTLDDEADWRRLWTEYLNFYETTVTEEVYAETWKRLHTDGEFEPKCLLAVTHTKPMGLVHFLYHRTAWSVANNCYLQDLYVDPERRGTGLGRVLIEAVRRGAAEKGVTNIYWLTQENNATARQLYDRIAENTGFIRYRME